MLSKLFQKVNFLEFQQYFRFLSLLDSNTLFHKRRSISKSSQKKNGDQKATSSIFTKRLGRVLYLSVLKKDKFCFLNIKQTLVISLYLVGNKALKGEKKHMIEKEMI